MALTKIQSPDALALSNNPMFLVSTPTSAYSGYTGYYVQYELYDSSSTLLFQSDVKVYEGIYGGKAVWNMNKVAENYTTYSVHPLTGTTGIYSTPECMFWYKISAKEYNNTSLLYNYANFATGYTIQGAINQEYEFDYTDYITTGNGKFLSPWVGKRVVRMTDSFTLSWIHKISNIYIKAIAVDVYCSDGSIKNYSYISNVYTASTTVQNVGIGPREIESMTFQTGYTVTATTDATNILTSNGSTKYIVKGLDASINRCTEEVEFEISTECNLIEDIQLMWLNKLGAWDSYTFYKEFHKQLKIEKETFKKNNFQFLGNKMVVMPYERGETILDMDVTEHYTVISKILSNTMSTNLATLFESPEVYWLKKDGSTITAIPIMIDADTIEIKNNYNRPDRAIYTFNFYKANKNITLNS